MKLLYRQKFPQPSRFLYQEVIDTWEEMCGLSPERLRNALDMNYADMVKEYQRIFKEKKASLRNYDEARAFYEQAKSCLPRLKKAVKGKRGVNDQIMVDLRVMETRVIRNLDTLVMAEQHLEGEAWKSETPDKINRRVHEKFRNESILFLSEIDIPNLKKFPIKGESEEEVKMKLFKLCGGDKAVASALILSYQKEQNDAKSKPGKVMGVSALGGLLSGGVPVLLGKGISSLGFGLATKGISIPFTSINLVKPLSWGARLASWGKGALFTNPWVIGGAVVAGVAVAGFFAYHFSNRHRAKEFPKKYPWLAQKIGGIAQYTYDNWGWKNKAVKDAIKLKEPIKSKGIWQVRTVPKKAETEEGKEIVSLDRYYTEHILVFKDRLELLNEPEIDPEFKDRNSEDLRIINDAIALFEQTQPSKIKDKDGNIIIVRQRKIGEENVSADEALDQAINDVIERNAEINAIFSSIHHQNNKLHSDKYMKEFGVDPDIDIKYTSICLSTLYKEGDNRRLRTRLQTDRMLKLCHHLNTESSSEPNAFFQFYDQENAEENGLPYYREGIKIEAMCNAVHKSILHYIGSKILVKQNCMDTDLRDFLITQKGYRGDKLQQINDFAAMIGTDQEPNIDIMLTKSRQSIYAGGGDLSHYDQDPILNLMEDLLLYFKETKGAEIKPNSLDMEESTLTYGRTAMELLYTQDSRSTEAETGVYEDMDRVINERNVRRLKNKEAEAKEKIEAEKVLATPGDPRRPQAWEISPSERALREIANESIQQMFPYNSYDKSRIENAFGDIGLQEFFRTFGIPDGPNCYKHLYESNFYEIQKLSFINLPEDYTIGENNKLQNLALHNWVRWTVMNELNGMNLPVFAAQVIDSPSRERFMNRDSRGLLLADQMKWMKGKLEDYQKTEKRLNNGNKVHVECTAALTNISRYTHLNRAFADRAGIYRNAWQLAFSEGFNDLGDGKLNSARIVPSEDKEVFDRRLTMSSAEKKALAEEGKYPSYNLRQALEQKDYMGDKMSFEKIKRLVNDGTYTITLTFNGSKSPYKVKGLNEPEPSPEIIIETESNDLWESLWDASKKPATLEPESVIPNNLKRVTSLVLTPETLTDFENGVYRNADGTKMTLSGIRMSPGDNLHIENNMEHQYKVEREANTAGEMSMTYGILRDNPDQKTRTLIFANPDSSYLGMKHGGSGYVMSHYHNLAEQRGEEFDPNSVPVSPATHAVNVWGERPFSNTIKGSVSLTRHVWSTLQYPDGPNGVKMDIAFLSNAGSASAKNDILGNYNINIVRNGTVYIRNGKKVVYDHQGKETGTENISLANITLKRNDQVSFSEFICLEARGSYKMNYLSAIMRQQKYSKTSGRFSYRPMTLTNILEEKDNPIPPEVIPKPDPLEYRELLNETETTITYEIPITLGDWLIDNSIPGHATKDYSRERGKLVIYKPKKHPYFDQNKQVREPQPHPFDNKKEYVCWHGTGTTYEDRNISNKKLDIKQYNGLRQNANASYLITSTGLVFNYFDHQTGQGGLGVRGKYCLSDPDVNKKTIAIEAVVRSTFKGRYVSGTDDMNAAQISSGKTLVATLEAELQKGNPDFSLATHSFDSKDATTYKNGNWWKSKYHEGESGSSHVDQFSDEVMIQLGALPRAQRFDGNGAMTKKKQPRKRIKSEVQ